MQGSIWRIARRAVIMDGNINQPGPDSDDQGTFKTLTLRGARGPGDPADRC